MKRYGLKLSRRVGGDKTRFIAIRGIILFVAMFAALADPRSGGPAIMFVGVGRVVFIILGGRVYISG